MTMNLPWGNEVDPGQQIIMRTRGNACPGAVITPGYFTVPGSCEQALSIPVSPWSPGVGQWPLPMAIPPNCHSVTGVGSPVPSVTLSQVVLSFQDPWSHLCSVTLSHGISSQSFSIYCHSVTQEFFLVYLYVY